MAAAKREAEIKSRLEECKKEIENLKEEIKAAKENVADEKLRDSAKDLAAAPNPKLSCKRTLKGHSGKIYSMDWGDDSKSLVSAAQDGILLVWDGITTAKTHAYQLRCSWVMTCAFAPSGNFVACGGLGNSISVYSLKESNTRPTRELEGHNGHLSCCKFLSDKQIISSSGDYTCVLWDVEANKQIVKFDDHQGDVLSVSINPQDKNCFVSGSTDRTAKLFDIRTKDLAQISFTSHTDDINDVAYFPSGTAFGTASEDKTARLFDIKAGQELIGYADEFCGFTSVDFSKSGRYIFTSVIEGNVVNIWDTLKGNHITNLKGHKNRVSSLSVTKDGRALGTASWDNQIKIWA